jgi:chromosome segregation ATPase
MVEGAKTKLDIALVLQPASKLYIMEIKDELDSLLQDYQDAVDELDTASTTIRTLERKNEDAGAVIRSCKGDMEDLRLEIARISGDYKRATSELEAARRELEELKAQQLLTSNKPTCPQGKGDIMEHQHHHKVISKLFDDLNLYSVPDMPSSGAERIEKLIMAVRALLDDFESLEEERDVLRVERPVQQTVIYMDGSGNQFSSDDLNELREECSRLTQERNSAQALAGRHSNEKFHAERLAGELQQKVETLEKYIDGLDTKVYLDVELQDIVTTKCLFNCRADALQWLLDKHFEYNKTDDTYDIRSNNVVATFISDPIDKDKYQKVED